jgi:hypothetical protein
VVHPNLKLILVVQAAIIGIGALIETVSSGLKIARQDPLMLDPPLLAALRSFCMGVSVINLSWNKHFHDGIGLLRSDMELSRKYTGCFKITFFA